MKTLLALVGAAGLAACSSDPAQPPPAVDAGRADIGGQDVPAAPTDTGSVDAAPDVPQGPLPDLTVDQGILQQNTQFTAMYFPPGACEIAEGCVARPGWRRLLMFTTFTPNIGDADLNLGSSNTMNPNFEYSTCHMHYHFRGYAAYSLLGADGGVAAIGHKQSFCVEDLQRVDQSAGIRTTGHFRNCGEAGGQQGISRGWADDYYPNLPCQWIDVTDVPAGDYTLQVSINTEHRFAESDYSNNTVTVPVTVPTTWTTDNPLAPCPAGGNDQGMGRNCGWTREGTHSCHPGDQVSVGCNAMYHVGTCTGSWDIRVCKGSQPCDSGDLDSVLQADSGEGSTGIYRLESTCGVAVFTCPAEGMYTVLTAPDFYGDPSPGVCTLATVISPVGGDGGAPPSDASTSSDGGAPPSDGGVAASDAGAH